MSGNVRKGCRKRKRATGAEDDAAPLWGPLADDEPMEGENMSYVLPMEEYDEDDYMPGEDEDGDEEIDMKVEGVVGILVIRSARFRDPEQPWIKRFHAYLAYEEQTWPFAWNMESSMALWQHRIHSTTWTIESLLNRTRWNMFLIGVWKGRLARRPEDVSQMSAIGKFGAHPCFEKNVLSKIRSFLGDCRLHFGIESETEENWETHGCQLRRTLFDDGWYDMSSDEETDEEDEEVVWEFPF